MINKLCMCGCNFIVNNSRNNYINGHNSRKYTINHNAFDNLNSEEVCYWVGFIAADGSLDIKNKVLTIKLAPKDYGHLVKFSKFINSNRPINILVNTTSQPELRINSNNIYDTLCSYGIIPNKSERDFSITNDTLINSKDFWRGVIDGDGCLSFDTGKRLIIHLCGNYALLLQYVKFVYVNVKVNLNIRPVGNIYQVALCGSNAIKLVSLLYKDSVMYLDRKMELAKTIFKCFRED